MLVSSFPRETRKGKSLEQRSLSNRQNSQPLWSALLITLKKARFAWTKTKTEREKKRKKFLLSHQHPYQEKKIQNLFKTRLHNRYHGRCAPRQCTTQMKRDTIDPHARWVAGFPTAVEHRCCRQMNECGRTRDWRSKRCPTFVVPLYPLSLSLFRTLSLTATSSHNINDS